MEKQIRFGKTVSLTIEAFKGLLAAKTEGKYRSYSETVLQILEKCKPESKPESQLIKN